MPFVINYKKTLNEWEKVPGENFFNSNFHHFPWSSCHLLAEILHNESRRQRIAAVGYICL